MINHIRLKIICLLLTLWVLPQGLFAITISQEIESFNDLYVIENEFNKLDTLRSIEVQLNQGFNLPGLYSQQSMGLKVNIDRLEFGVDALDKSFSIEQEDAKYTQVYPVLNSYLLIPVFINKQLEINYGWSYYSGMSNMLRLQLNRYHLALSGRLSRFNYESDLIVGGDSLSFYWSQLNPGIKIEWRSCEQWGCGSLNYDFEYSQPSGSKNDILAQSESKTHQSKWSWNKKSFGLNGGLYFSQNELNLQGNDYDKPFLYSNFTFLKFNQNLKWASLGAHFSYWQFESPHPDPNWSIDPSSYPKEGLDSFWFIKSNQFLRWSMLGRFAYWGASWTPKVVGESGTGKSWTLSFPNKIGRLSYNIQELKDDHSKWLLFIPVRETFISQNTGNSYADLWSSGLDFEWQMNNWGFSFEFQQLIPLHSVNGDLTIKKVVNQESKDVSTNPNVNGSLEQVDAGQTDFSLGEDSDYEFGDGLIARVVLNYSW